MKPAAKEEQLQNRRLQPTQDGGRGGTEASEHSAEVDGSQERQTDRTERRIRRVRRPQVCPRTETVWQTSDASVADHRTAVQETLSTWNMELKYRTVVLEVLPRQPRRDRVSHSGVEDLS